MSVVLRRLTNAEIDKLLTELLRRKKNKADENRGKTRHTKESCTATMNKYRIKMNEKGELPLKHFCYLKFRELKVSYNFVAQEVNKELILSYLVQKGIIRFTQGEDKWTGSGLSRRKVEGRKRYYVKQKYQDDFIEFIRTYFVDEKWDGYRKDRRLGKRQ